MKLKFLLPVVIFALSIFVSCTSKEEKLALANIEEFFKGELGDSVNIDVREYSRMYVLSSSDSLPKDMTRVQAERGEIHQWMQDYHELYGVSVAMAFKGLSDKIYSQIIRNDQTFRDLGPNWTQYFMIGFYNLSQGEKKNSYCACFIMDKDFNVERAYGIDEISKIYKMAMDDK